MLEPWQLALLAVAGFASGWINVIAGGGSLLTVPVMVFLGLPGPVANGTNRIAIIAQNITAVGAFFRNGLSDFRLSITLALAASAAAYPGGTPDFQTDAAPYCASCHASANVEMMSGIAPERAQKELAANKHVALIRAGEGAYQTLSPDERGLLAEHVRAVDLLHGDQRGSGEARGSSDARAHGWSREPIVEMLIPSTLDDTLAPPGQHVASLFCQHVQPVLSGGRSWDRHKDEVADLMIATVDKVAPGFADSVVGRQALSPLDLERRFGLVNGDIMHGALSLDQLFSARPVLGHGDYRMPIKRLYLCGAGAHPGGGVSGRPGRNAAREIARDLRLSFQ